MISLGLYDRWTVLKFSAAFFQNFAQDWKNHVSLALWNWKVHDTSCYKFVQMSDLIRFQSHSDWKTALFHSQSDQTLQNVRDVMAWQSRVRLITLFSCTLCPVSSLFLLILTLAMMVICESFCVEFNARIALKETMTELPCYFMLCFIFADK